MGSFLDQNTEKRGCLTGVFVVLIGTFLCMGGMMAAIDISCGQDARLWLVDYPNAQLISESYTFIRPFGLGETVRILTSPDSAADIRLWYNERNTTLSKEGASRGNRIVNTQWRVTEVEGGSRITLYAECASDFF